MNQNAKCEKRAGSASDPRLPRTGPPSVIVYTVPDCPGCVAAAEYLRNANVPFETHDVTADRQRAREMVLKRRRFRSPGSRRVRLPVLDVAGTIVEGFDKARVAAALADTGERQ